MEPRRDNNRTLRPGRSHADLIYLIMGERAMPFVATDYSIMRVPQNRAHLLCIFFWHLIQFGRADTYLAKIKASN